MNSSFDRSFLERYQKCSTASDVSTMQENIIEELTKDYEESRRSKGLFFATILFISRLALELTKFLIVLAFSQVHINRKPRTC